MTERDAIDATATPATVGSLVADLRSLGVGSGTTVMVHSSLSNLGFVAGGAQTVVTALQAAIGPTGSIVMPTHSGDLSDPGSWSDPPVPEAWWDTLRAELPPYDPALTPTRQMGAIVECFRHVPGVVRSAHPTVSAAAVGPNAAFIVAGHQLAHGLGETSPQARVNELDGHILLLGVSHANNTSLHLAEYRAARPGHPTVSHSSPITVDGERRWASYEQIVDDDSDFARLGEAFALAGGEATGPIGAGTGRLMRSRAIVDFAVDWMRANRSPPERS